MAHSTEAEFSSPAVAPAKMLAGCMSLNVGVRSPYAAPDQPFVLGYHPSHLLIHQQQSARG